MAPHDVFEDVADVLGLVERGEHGADGVGPDLMPALHELDELVDDCPRGGDMLAVAVECQAVPAQRNRAVEPLAKRVEHAVSDSRQLGCDLVRDVQYLVHRLSLETRSAAPPSPSGRGRPRP
jgi:hypothetical protein